MYRYFIPVPENLDTLKVMYRRLAIKFHPDVGGDTETMKVINSEHDTLFEILKAKHNARAASDTTGRTKATTETAEEFRDILDLLLKLDGLTVELCGCWLWIGGNTRANKEQLKAAGCLWSSKKKLWYWRHPENASGWHGKGKSMNDIRMKYGSTVYTNDNDAA